MPAVLDVDPDVYLSVGHTFLDVNDAVCDIVAAASTSANGAGGMAGVDSTGAAWASDYDQAADSLLRAGSVMVDALGVVGDRLLVSGSNHDDAETASIPQGTPGAGPPAYPGQPGTTRAVAVIVSAPPSADGTPTDPPPGWSIIAHLLAFVWPAGHPEQLYEVGGGWLTASLKLSDQADRLTGPIGELSGQKSPEVPFALTMCTGLQTSTRTLADAYATVAKACTGYGNAIAQMHHDVVAELVDLVASEAVIEVVGGLASVPTAGLAEVPTQGVAGSRATLAAIRVGEILSRLAREVVSLGNLVKGVTEQGLNVLIELQKIIAARGVLQAVAALIDSGIPPIDLTANERDNPTAHVIRDHVNLTNDDLKNRGKLAASTFTSLAVATTVISSLIAANQKAISAWLAGSRRDLDLFGPLPAGAGRAYLRDSKRVVACTQVKITLLRNSHGYYIVTAFPVP